MDTSSLEVAHIVRARGEVYRQRFGHHLARRHLRALRAIEICRSAALGGHRYRCERCDHERIAYNSCRNRHCPKCQTLDKERWIEARRAELLPVDHFHVVFTLPAALRPLALRNQRTIYTLLFRSAAETLLEIGADSKHLGARIGFVAILHTWGQTLVDHPHLHVIVPGGGLALTGDRWVSARRRFLLPVRVLSRLFRGKFLHYLREAHAASEIAFPGTIEELVDPPAFDALLDRLYGTDWMVYCKPPLGGAHAVLEYLPRYTHRVAISNDRLVAFDGETVTFRFKDYRQEGRVGVMHLSAEEFLRRFLLHILPERFVRIRYYGLWAHRCRKENLELCRQLMRVRPGPEPVSENWSELLLRLTGIDPTLCPVCGKGRLIAADRLAPIRYPARAPP